MRKAFKLCLALAMAGSMAAGTAFAGDTEIVVSGEAFFYFDKIDTDYNTEGLATGKQKTFSFMDSKTEGAIKATATNKGEVWTTTASVNIAVKSKGDIVEEDGLNAKMSNGQISINVGTDDLSDATKNPAHFEGDKIDVGDELGKGDAGIVFGLPEVGVEAMYRATAERDEDKIQSTAFGVSFDKTFGDIELSVEYETVAKEIDEDVGAVSSGKTDGKDGVNDGYSASDWGIGVKYSMNPIAVMLNYGTTEKTNGGKLAKDAKILDDISAAHPGADKSYKSVEDVNMMLAVDYAIDDVSGISLVYQQLVETDNQAVVFDVKKVESDDAAAVAAALAEAKVDSIKTTETRIGAGYGTKVGAMAFQVFYEMISNKSDNSGILSDLANLSAAKDEGYGAVNDEDWKTTRIGVKVGMEF